MELRTTDALNHEIKSATDIEDFLTKNREHLLNDNLPEHLQTLLVRKNISRADVVRGSLLDRAYVYQIFSGEKVPSRDERDALILFAIQQKKNIFWVNELLISHCLTVLGAAMK